MQSQTQPRTRPAKAAALALALAAACAMPAFAAGPNLVSNGDFESGSISGWTSSGTFDFTTVNCFAGCFGNYALDSGARGALSFISQSLATAAGTTYGVSLWLQNDGEAPNELRVDFGGATVFDVQDIGKQGYTQLSFQVAATSSLSNLRIGFRNDNGFLQIDNIAVQAVPEPASLLMLGVGLGVLALRRARRQ